MPDELEKLIDAAKRGVFPVSEREAQRRSFAYGNTKIENPRITRQTVDGQAEKLKSQAIDLTEMKNLLGNTGNTACRSSRRREKTVMPSSAVS